MRMSQSLVDSDLQFKVVDEHFVFVVLLVDYLHGIHSALRLVSHHHHLTIRALSQRRSSQSLEILRSPPDRSEGCVTLQVTRSSAFLL